MYMPIYAVHAYTFPIHELHIVWNRQWYCWLYTYIYTYEVAIYSCLKNKNLATNKSVYTHRVQYIYETIYTCIHLCSEQFFSSFAECTSFFISLHTPHTSTNTDRLPSRPTHSHTYNYTCKNILEKNSRVVGCWWILVCVCGAWVYVCLFCFCLRLFLLL